MDDSDVTSTGASEPPCDLGAQRERAAAADLVRMAEPGDVLLAALVRAVGFVEARGLAASDDGGDRRRAVEAVVEELGGRGGGADASALGARMADAFARWAVRVDELDGARDLRIMQRLDGRLVIPADGEWPIGLDDLGTHAPLALWVRGPSRLNAVLQRSAAIVGARAADSYGLTVTKMLTWDLAGDGWTIVSGGAYGVDAAAHRTALAADAPTVAFMAGGADTLYPRGNDQLLTGVLRSGAIVSEAAPGQTAMRHRFLLRNRLIAAASRTTVVTAAGHRSGALNTAYRAAELLRPVGAVPGSVMSDQSAGCHRLIRDGAAVLVADAQDVVALAAPLTETRDEPADVQTALRLTDSMHPHELQMYSALPVRRGVDVPTLAARAGLGVGTAMAALGMLEVAGHARRTDTGWVKGAGSAG
ncbi:DNA-processing protein DprA [Brevibacterium jeotgali]|uniref:DNA processing protein n=1 Tax=Brevibacterium jeotgali TaxID=1262550 RepID=A0A2H1L316_9MICO|nr:DNA-processing protein DprA [Brevibacterium jeotgali]TWC02486.1 DNA processing protein [Brevibacterium jeotgali]SMY11278.1 DNA processing protein [Brevibacterium jeotgali]